jgi:hypothetical protein
VPTGAAAAAAAAAVSVRPLQLPTLKVTSLHQGVCTLQS